MMKELIRYLVVAGAGFALWQWGQVVAKTNELWDTHWFLPFYGAALGLSAALGLLFHDRAWRWGFIVVLALFPSMIVDARPGNGGGLWPVGLMFTAFLALPGAAAAAGAAQVRKLFTRSKRP